MKVSVLVKAGSSQGPKIEESSSDSALTVFVRERAVDGQANDAVIKLVAKHFGVAKSRVCILSGFRSKNKIVEVDADADADA